MAEIKNCRLCGGQELKKVYEGAIRSGGADSGVVEGFAVYGCSACGIEFLDPFPQDLESYYETPDYWTAHHGPVDVAKLQAKHGPEQERWFYEVGFHNLRGKRLGDFGCGVGIFLDMARGVASETVGIDLAEYFKEHLAASGHRFAKTAEELAATSLDVAVAFDTLEHVPDPVAFLQGIHRTLESGGQLFIGVPNQTDFLKKLVSDYLPFFYHLSHLYYFSAQALSFALEQAGFKDVKVGYVHKYDLMNMLVWARDRKGIGKQGSAVFDRAAEESFRADLERQGIASHLFVQAVKA
jgi:SAM-dependent methyltransferase